MPLALALAVAALLRTHWTMGWGPLLLRTVVLALAGLLAFGLFERWPPRLPGWLPRWVLQVVGVGLAMPLATLAFYGIATEPGAPPFWRDEGRMEGFLGLTFLGLLVAPWTALIALVRQREAFAREQALAFELERTKLERVALEARLHLLQAQVAPHFLFNTLANVQALVDTGSPRASTVLGRLVTYLRAAVPTLAEPEATVAREVELVEAYLEVMRLRMGERLDFSLRADPAALALPCPSTALLTLHIGRRAHVVFVTAYDHYAVEAFAQGALDYLLKPVEQRRLEETVRRLEERLAAARPAVNTEGLVRALEAQLSRLGAASPAPLRWLRAQAGRSLRLIAVEDVAYLRSDAKHTRVAWRGDSGEPLEAHVRAPLKDLLAQLDREQFVQVHRAVVVNLRAIAQVRRRDNETAEIHLKERKEVLPVSRAYLHLFRQM